MQQYVSKRVLSIIFIIMILIALPCSSMAASGSGDGSRSPKLIAFSYDDGPSAATEALLDGLKERNAYVTFFMTGLLDTEYGKYGIEYYSDLADRMVREGHQLGNHSYYHIDMDKSTVQEIRTQAINVNKLLAERMGGKYRYMFRPPHGQCTTEIRSALDMPICLWNVDSFDWKYIDADVVYGKIMNGASDGTVVDLHDLSPTSVEGSLRAVDALQKKGYEFVTIAELMRRRGVTPENGEEYRSFPDRGTTLPPYEKPELTVTEDHEARVVKVTCSTPDSGVTLHYTTDGTYPLLSSPVFDQAVTVTEETEFTVAGYDEFGTRTPLLQEKVKEYTVAQPKAASEDGKIAITCETPGAEIYYTLDGSKPGRKSKKYNKPFRPQGEQLRIVGLLKNVKSSRIKNYTVTENGMIFTDLDPEAWYFDPVRAVIRDGIMTGNSNQTFEPDRAVTRAMALEVLYKLAEQPKPSKDQPDKMSRQYVDVVASDSYADAVRWALSEGIASEKSEEEFGAADELTREELANLIYHFMKDSCRVKIKNIVPLSDYKDGYAVAVNSREAVSWTAGNGILTDPDNKDKLQPKEVAARADLAAAVVRCREIGLKPTLLQRLIAWLSG